MSRLQVDLPKMAHAVNVGIPLGAVATFLLGHYVSFYFHFATSGLIILTIFNFFYRHVQTRHAILRNFGFMGQMRYLIESIGPEFRQYLYSSDTEEKPFNRVERAEVYRKAKDEDSSVPFGTLMNYDKTEMKLRHSMFPVDKRTIAPFKLTFGEERGIKNTFTITKPLIISAMSYGALGENAVRSLARGARLAGIPMNTGEGGYPKYHMMEGCDLIFQMGTAKFGVRNEDGTLNEEKLKTLASQPQIKMIEIKFSQGAKPGKGGLLPKEKVSEEIAELRGVPMGVDVISPPCHVECKDMKTTVQFIKRIQTISQLPVGVKMCLGNPKEFTAFVKEMKKQKTYPDYISIDGAEGGTGAAPKSFVDQVGMPLFPALRFVQETLVKEGIRNKMKLMCAGKLTSAGKQTMAMAHGADAVYTARGFMLAIGCIQALQCNNNTCPVGITTHDKSLQAGLVIEDKAQRVANYVHNLEHDFYELLAATGNASPHDLNLDNVYIPEEETAKMRG